MTRILFVTWDGPQVTYLESLFVPIFAALRRRHNIHVDILQFRWGTVAQEATVRTACNAAECGYRSVKINRRGGAVGPFLTALAGGRHIRKSAHIFGSQIVMPRSLMAGLATLAASRVTLPILFDSDGLAADEKVEFGGLSPSSPIYRTLRWVESTLVRRSAAVLVRTDQAASILSERSGVGLERFATVVNGRDEQHFTPSTEASRSKVRQELGVALDAPLLVYAGSAGPQYRFDLMAAATTVIAEREPKVRLLILTGQPDEAKHLLGPGLEKLTIIRSVGPAFVPAYLATADAGFSFRATSLSTRAIAPIKLGEYLLCGLPVIGTSAVGDTAELISRGVFKSDLPSLSDTTNWLLERILPNREHYRTLAREAGIEKFGIAQTAEAYARMIKAVSERAK